MAALPPGLLDPFTRLSLWHTHRTAGCEKDFDNGLKQAHALAGDAFGSELHPLYQDLLSPPVSCLPLLPGFPPKDRKGAPNQELGSALKEVLEETNIGWKLTVDQALAKGFPWHLIYPPSEVVGLASSCFRGTN